MTRLRLTFFCSLAATIGFIVLAEQQESIVAQASLYTLALACGILMVGTIAKI